MSVQNVGSNLAALLTLVTCLGVATLGFCSVVPLASSAADVIVLPLTVKGLSSTDDPAVSNDRSPFADCGVANGNPVLAGGKIIGGVETAPNEFPWQAYLQVEMESGNIYSCAGSLVSERWILTSAGCVTEENENTKSILVYLGLHSRSNSSTEAHAKMYEGQDLLVHSGWNPYSFVNNTALVYLSTAVTFTQYIRPACLADPTEPSYLGEDVTVTGWGATSDADTTTSGNSEVLRKLTVPVISNAQCNSYYYVFDNEMCTSGDNSQGICVGDNGGPLNFKQPDGTWKQIGIVSFWPSAGCTRAGYPTIYMRLSSLSTWVQQIIAPETTPTAPTDAPTDAPTVAPTDAPTTTKSPTTTSIETTVTTTQKTTTPTTKAPTTSTTAAPTTPTTTASITNPPTTFSCAGKPNGNYANPESSCSNTFYKCSNGNAYLYNCAATLVYREVIGACDWPSNVAGCN